MRCLIALLASVAVVAGPAASADHQAGHMQPAGPAVQHFPEGFEPPLDAEWGWELGGFGGPTDERTDHDPVVFVHGNNTDHATWFLVAQRMVAEHGWGRGDLWALSYNGVGCTNDGALYTSNTGYNGWTYQEDRASSSGCVVTANDVNVPDLVDFIDAVREYTHAPRVHVVAHSLGVTLARKALADPQMNGFDRGRRLFNKVAGFVAIAGANHGTSFCPPGSEDVVHSCDEIAADTDWLDELNGIGETPGKRTRWMTVYDGSGVGDPAFAGTYAGSPRLDGAVNCAFPGFYHSDLRVDPRIVDGYVAFLEAVEGGDDFTCPPPPDPVPPSDD